MLTQMNLDVAVIAEQSAGGPRLLKVMGSMPENANPQALLGQSNPLRHTLVTGETLMVADVEDGSDWLNTPLLRAMEGRAFISLPIASNGYTDAAILALSHTALPDFTEEDKQVFELIGSQVAIALQNLTLLTETRRRLREVNLLLEFSRQLGTLDPAEILRNLVQNARRVISTAHGSMALIWDEGRKLLVPEMASGYTENELLRRVTFGKGEALPGEVFESGEPQIIPEVDFAAMYNIASEKLLHYREATGGRVPVSSLVIPIQAGEITLGVFVLDNFNTPDAFTGEDLALIESLSQQTALTLVNARLFEETRRFNEELEQRVAERTEELRREHQFSQTLLRISTELSSSLDLDHVLNRSLSILNDSLGSEQASIMITRPSEEFLIYRAGTGITESPPTGGRESAYRIGEGLAGWVILHKKPLVIPELGKDGRWVGERGDSAKYNSAIVVPLSVGEDTIGALLLYHTQKNHFSPDQVDAVQAAANQFAVSINNGELFRLIRDQASDLGTMLRSQQVENSRSTAMLEGVADGVLVTDAENQITLFNDAAVKILELPRNQVVGRSLDHFMGLFGKAAESWITTIRRWAEHKVTREVSEIYSEQIVLEDGRVVSVHLAPVSDAKEFLGTVSIFRDITHQVEVDRLKSEFVATVSHELRTPMTPIKGYVEFLMMGGAGELNEQQVQFMDIIKSNIDRLSVLVNDLLDVSRIEAGKVGLNLQPVDMREVTEDILAINRQKATEEGRPIEFTLEAVPPLANVYGDPERVRQIVANLVDNAYRYSEPESQVIVRVREIEDHIQVDVQDQGIGIYPDEHERIFERFYRGENPLVFASAGTGLGLAIVRELIEMHTGRIWLTSSGVPGEGSTFSFVLPVYDPEKELKPTRLEGNVYG
jgi:PAS domain S-box-containing protein